MKSSFQYAGIDCTLDTHRHKDGRLALTFVTRDTVLNRRKGFLPGVTIATASLYLPIDHCVQLGYQEAALADPDGRNGLLAALLRSGAVQDTGKRYYWVGAAFPVVRLIPERVSAMEACEQRRVAQ